jgi:SPP1 family predicted phage head-tail adaptor
MRAGKLRHRVTIQSVTEGAQDANGEPAETTATLATRWASIEPLGGSEQYRSHEVHPEVTHAVRMRYLAGVTPKMRIVFGSRTFEIESVIVADESNREIVCACKELL